MRFVWSAPSDRPEGVGSDQPVVIVRVRRQAGQRRPHLPGRRRAMRGPPARSGSRRPWSCRTASGRSSTCLGARPSPRRRSWRCPSGRQWARASSRAAETLAAGERRRRRASPCRRRRGPAPPGSRNVCSSARVASGNIARSSAAAPATCGAADDVPVNRPRGIDRRGHRRRCGRDRLDPAVDRRPDGAVGLQDVGRPGDGADGERARRGRGLDDAAAAFRYSSASAIVTKRSKRRRRRRRASG